MTELAFLILMTFAADAHVEVKRLYCATEACIHMIEDRARESTTLMRFRVFRPGEGGIVQFGGASVFQPLIEWSPT